MIAPLWVDAPEGRVDFPDARRAILAITRSLSAETVALDDAYGRVLAAPLRADDDLVPFTRSAMDGYAVRAEETREANAREIVLPVAGALYAGELPSVLLPGTALAIATGAVLPSGADAVIPVEDVEERVGTIAIGAPVPPGNHVFAPGDDAKRGELLVLRGDIITPGRAALLASAGHVRVAVYRRPRVAILCTGDELVDVGERPAHGQIRNSNATMLRALLQADGADVAVCRHVPDAWEPLRAALREAISTCDLVVTTGGASAGKHDFVKDTLASLDAAFAFRSVALRPAKPSAFARCGGTLIAVLPGNPAAVFIAYMTLVRVCVRRLAGHRVPIGPGVTARLRGSLHARADRHYIAFARLEYEAGTLVAIPLGNQCSSLVRTSADADALIFVPPGEDDLADGMDVMVESINAFHQLGGTAE